MAYNKDAHRADITQQTINDLQKSIDDLRNELEESKNKIRELLAGNGAPLENIPATNLTGELPLEVLPVRNDSGLCTLGGELSLSPRHVKRLSEKGQTISQDDVVLLYDSSREEIRQVNLMELYKQFIHLQIPHAAGHGGHIQIKGGADFTSTPDLKYDASRKTFVINSLTETQNLKVKGSFQTNISKIENDYVVEASDHTLIIDTTEKDVTVTLPRPSLCEGRLIIIKKASDLNQIALNCVNAKIDNKEIQILKDENSYITVQSDSHNWWVVNKVSDTSDWWISKKTQPQ
tara:strand:+ start:1218 stop:2090 length:873 start_codon:yes stop_codon:yes gene_type:complete